MVPPDMAIYFPRDKACCPKGIRGLDDRISYQAAGQMKNLYPCGLQLGSFPLRASCWRASSHPATAVVHMGHPRMATLLTLAVAYLQWKLGM